MKRLTLIAVLAWLAACPCWGADVADFHKTWADAEKAARAENKPIYLHFTTTWCGWCRKIEKETYTSKSGSAALAGFVTASLDCTVPRGQKPSPAAKINLDLKEKFGGSGYPFLVMTTPDQAVLNTVAGFVQPDRFAKELAQAEETRKELLDFEAWAAKADKSSYEYHHKAMQMYDKVRLSEKATAAAGKVRELDPENKKGDAAQATWVLLSAASRARPVTPAAAKAREAKMQALVAEARKFDPNNDKRVLQRVLYMEFNEKFAQARRTSDAATRKGLLKEAEGKLAELATSAPSFERLQYLWAVLGDTYAGTGCPDEARAALDKAIQVDPDSPLVPKIKALLAQIKAPQ